MVGIYAKIKNGLNWIKNKGAKYVAPVVGGLGNIANSDLIQGAASFLNPYLNTVVPGLGTGISTGLSLIGKAGDIASGLAAHYDKLGENFSFSDMYNNVRSGKYSRKSKLKDSIGLAKRPDELHPLIELKSLPAPDDLNDTYPRGGGPIVEEID